MGPYTYYLGYPERDLNFDNYPYGRSETSAANGLVAHVTREDDAFPGLLFWIVSYHNEETIFLFTLDR